jgi:hypothetical protein
MKNVTIGGKYVAQYSEHPGPGHYEENHKHTKAKVQSATIHPESPSK